MQRLTGMFADKQYTIALHLTTGQCTLTSEPAGPVHLGIVTALEEAITDRARLLFGDSFHAAIDPPAPETLVAETTGPAWSSSAHHEAEDTVQEPSA